MSRMFEIVFENVAPGKVVQLFMQLVAYSKKLGSVQCSEEIGPSSAGELDADALNSVVQFPGSVTVVVDATDMNFGGLALPAVVLRLVKYDARYDIDFSFDLNEVSGIGILGALNGIHRCVGELARDHEVREFFGGMEPASDAETRYFTNNCFGPLKIS